MEDPLELEALLRLFAVQVWQSLAAFHLVQQQEGVLLVVLTAAFHLVLLEH